MLPRLAAALFVVLLAAACEGVMIEPLPEDEKPKSYDIPNI